MSEKSTQDGSPQGGKPVEIEVNITGKEEIERLQKELDNALASKKTAEEKILEVEKIRSKIAEKETERDAQIADLAKKQKSLSEQLEAERTAKEDYQNKLELAAEKEFQKAKTNFLDLAKGKVSDEKFKEMTEKIDNPEKLELIKNTFSWLDENLKKGAEAMQKLQKQEEENTEEENTNAGDGTTTTGGGASGKAPLSSNQSPSSINVKQYGSFQEMYADLLNREKSKNPQVAQEAHEVINQLWDKMIKEVQAKQRSPIVNVKQDKPLNQTVKEGVARDRGEGA